MQVGLLSLEAALQKMNTILNCKPPYLDAGRLLLCTSLDIQDSTQMLMEFIVKKMPRKKV